jgi:DNA-binding transcriptional LysR family regulator
VELRQLYYFATLAEELHFGRAAAREHIVQSALSQQIQRLEREVGVPLVDRSTHHVRLTDAGEALLVEARQIVHHVQRAGAVARAATSATEVLRVAVGDASFDSMPQVLRSLQYNRPEFEIHQIEAGVPEQCQLLAEGRLDVGIGRASMASSEIASEVLRLDPVGVLIADSHPLVGLNSVPMVSLAGEPLLLADEAHAPEFNQFIREICRSAGFIPKVYRGTVQSVRGAADLVAQRRCIVCVPQSCGLVFSGLRWLPLSNPVSRYPWSLLWRADDRAESVRVVLDCARVLSRKLGWIDDPGGLADTLSG